MDLWSIGVGGIGICAFCYLWNFSGVVVFHICMVNCRGDTSAWSICALCYMLNIFGVVVFHTSMVNCHGGYICLKYMCIVLYVKCIWCSGIPYIYGILACGYILSEGTPHLKNRGPNSTWGQFIWKTGGSISS